MSVVIDASLCVSCGRCAEVCPGTLISAGEGGPARILYPDDCWGCASCVKACPERAVRLYLPPALGGRGGLLSCGEEGGRTVWRLERPGSDPVDFPGDPEAEGGY
ncbi:MAG: ferredoxin family protein [Deltaproteobacteria bacterium]|jgi:adenylylsulfate reductase subunit B|nr:ferredoxin family protein [Deltaproteobacteria bacterium]